MIRFIDLRGQGGRTMDMGKDIIDRINGHLEDHGMEIIITDPQTDLPIVEEGPPEIARSCHICGETLRDGMLIIPRMYNKHNNSIVYNVPCCMNLKDCLKKAKDRDTEIKRRVKGLREKVVLPL